jgi:hypothetical protein
MQPHVRCPSCNTVRVVTQRQARRVRAGEHDGRCRECRGIQHNTRHLERNLRFWLATYNTQVPHGTKPSDFIRAGGAPAELVDLAQTIFPPT